MAAKKMIHMMNDDVIRIVQLQQAVAALDTLNLPRKKRVRESLEAEIEYRSANIPIAIKVADND